MLTVGASQYNSRKPIVKHVNVKNGFKAVKKCGVGRDSLNRAGFAKALRRSDLDKRGLSGIHALNPVCPFTIIFTTYLHGRVHFRLDLFLIGAS
jgi:hypothetical protein